MTKLKRITNKELENILYEHHLWVTSNEKEGKRVNLCYTDLSGFNLNNVNLCMADLVGDRLYWTTLCGVEESNFCKDRWKECVPGVHFL